MPQRIVQVNEISSSSDPSTKFENGSHVYLCVRCGETNNSGLNRVGFCIVCENRTFLSFFLDDDGIFVYLPETDETDSFSDLLTRCVRTALKLREQGVKNGDVVSAYTSNHKDSCVPFIAALFLGAIPATFDPNVSYLDNIHLLQMVRPKIIFVSPEYVGLVEKLVKNAKVQTHLVTFGNTGKYSKFSEYIQQSPIETKFTSYRAKNESDTAVIIFSSGTTGMPKGICLSHETLLQERDPVKTSKNTNGNKQYPIFLTYSSLYWVTGVVTLIRSILHGNPRVVPTKFDAAEIWSLIEKYRINVIFLPPHLAEEFIKNYRAEVDKTSLRLLCLGGSRAPKNLMRNLQDALPHVTVLQGYALTEAGATVSIFQPQIPEEVSMQKEKPLSCGKILPNFQWKVVDVATGKLLGPNQQGELRIKSNLQMNGYYKLDSSKAYDSEGYLHTGDLVYYDEENCLFIVDRVKEMFKYKGYHIIPTIIEEVLLKHPCVRDAVVVGIPNDSDGDRPMALVVLRDGEETTSGEIADFVNRQVGDTQQLRAGVKIVGQLARTSTGKLKRYEIRKMVLDNKI